MKTQVFISLLAALMFSQHSFARTVSNKDGEIVEISSTVKANNIVSIAVGNLAQTITQIGSLESNKCKSRHIDVKVDNVIQTTIGDDVLTVLQMPGHDKVCD